MSTDTVLFALTTFQRATQQCPTENAYDIEQKRDLLLTTDYLRDQLLRGDAVAFTKAIDSGLASQPDRYDFIMDALYEDLGVCNREDFDAILMAE